MDTKIRVMFGLLLVCNVLLTLFLTGMVVETRKEVMKLDTRLATKADLINATAPQAEDVLGKNCSGCHSETRFGSFHGSEDEMIRMIQDMQSLAGTTVDPRDADKIHASLELLQCNTCHERERLREMTLKTDVERNEIIREMLQKSSGPTDDEDVERIKDSYNQIFGF